MERITVRANYTIVFDSTEMRIEFVARVKDSSEGYNLTERAQKAAARREKVPVSQIKITGCMGD